MAEYLPKSHRDSDSGSEPNLEKVASAGLVLDERRRAALAQVDDAPFSCVYQFTSFYSLFSLCIDGFT